MFGRFCAAAVLTTLLVIPRSARAQAVQSAGGPPGPTMAAATAGFHVSRAPDDPQSRQAAADQAAHSVGPDVALMIVGGAGFLVGLIIGGDAGIAIAIAGAIVALYGLYLYLR